MIDSVLNGTGNSRFLKSAVPAGTSWADALAMLQAGTFPVDFNGINTEGFQRIGTPLNKANLLKDATAAQIGLPPSTTPDGMFQALGNTGELHVWKKTITSGTGTYSLGAVQEGLHYIKWANYATSDSSVGTFEYGNEVSVDNDGTITGIKNPSTITIEPWYDDVSKANVFKGKFIKMISQVEANMSSFNIGEIWWIPADATMTTGLVNGEGNTRYIAASKRQQVIGVPAGTTTTYPVSTNPNAYQEGNDAKPAGYTLGEVVTGKVLASKCYNNTAIYYGKSVSVSDDGIVSILNPTTRTLSSTLSSAEIAAIKDSFVYFSGNENYSDVSSAFRYGNIVYIPADASVSTEYANSAYGVYIDRYQPVTGYAAIPAGTTIEYLGKLGDKAMRQVVSYVGTGAYGSDHPNSLTFNFVPKIVMIRCDGDSNNIFDAIYGMREVVTDFSSGYYVIVKWSKKTLSWYSDRSPQKQMNNSGDKYYVIAIG